jgi:O-antigen ligase
MLMAIPLAAGYLCALLVGSSRRDADDLRARVLWLSSPDGGKAILVALATLIMILSVGMSMSRSGIVCLVVGLSLIGWRLFRSVGTRRARLASVGLFLLLICVPVSWVGLNATVERFSTDNVGSVPMRLHAWRDTLSVVQDFPVAGTGLNTFGTAMIRYQTGNLDVHFQESHNDYLQLAAEGGLLLGLPILAAALLFARTVRRRFAVDQSRTASWIRFGAVAGLVAVGVQSLVEFSLQMPGNAALFVVLLALALHAPRVRRPDAPKTA